MGGKRDMSKTLTPSKKKRLNEVRPSSVRVSAAQESWIRSQIEGGKGLSLQYAFDCLLADLRGEERPKPGALRRAEASLKNESELSEAGQYKRARLEREGRGGAWLEVEKDED